MRKITLFLMSLFLTVGAMAQAITIEAGKLYRIKENRWSSKYLTIRSYNGDSNGQFGTVPFLDKAEGNADQVFFIEETDGGYYLKSKSGFYITHRGWCIDACDDGSKGKVAFVADDKTTESLENFHIKNVDVPNKYYKVELIGTAKGESEDTPHPFCDVDWGGENFATFNLEVVDDSEFTRTDYVHKEGNIDRNDDRGLRSFTLTDGTNSLQVTDIQPGSREPIYVDKSGQKLTTTAGATLKFSEFTWVGNAMHAYAYIDYNKDYSFTLGNNNKGEGAGEIVSYNYYQGKDITGATSSQNGRMTSEYNGSKVMPAFTLPADLASGEYRMRIKIDWDNNDADYGAENIATDGGCQCDITIVVEDAEPCTITYNYKEGDKLIASIEYVVNSGSAYPEWNTSKCEGVTITGEEEPTGNVTEDCVFNFDVEVNLPIKYSNNIEDATWYYIQCNPETRLCNYIQYHDDYIATEGADVKWVDKSFNSDIDTYTWAFIGNPITGFKVVNKSNEQAIKHAGNAAQVVDFNDATNFYFGYGRDANNNNLSSFEGGYFSLHNGGSGNKYLNGQEVATNQGGRIKYYSQSDRGSTFWATERKEFNVTVSDLGFATLYLDYAAYIPSGVEVYTINGLKSNDWLNLVQVEGTTIPANQGFILKNAGDYKFVRSTENVTIEGNLLSGTATAEPVEGAAYVLANINVAEDGQPAKMEIGMYKAELNKDADGNAGTTHFLNNANKAYLPATSVTGASLSASLRFDFGGTTGVEEVETEVAETVIYDLTGRRVNEITKAGVYIVNGKKVMVK